MQYLSVQPRLASSKNCWILYHYTSKGDKNIFWWYNYTFVSNLGDLWAVTDCRSDDFSMGVELADGDCAESKTGRSNSDSDGDWILDDAL